MDQENYIKMLTAILIKKQSNLNNNLTDDSNEILKDDFNDDKYNLKKINIDLNNIFRVIEF